MKITKQDLIAYVVPAIIGIIIGLCLVKCASKPVDNIKIVRDTVTLHDTVPEYLPSPKDSVRLKWVTRWLPSKPDTITQWETLTVHDSVAVQVPITSKHYSGKSYDAYISGFEPNLDSIFVYNETQLITETITRMKPPNKWSLSVNAGVDYGTTSQFWQPYASGELTINNDKRLQLGIEGGVKKNEVTNNFEPFAGAKLRLKIL